MKIVVLAGGLSPEREVSLCSGSLIANTLSKSGHEVVLVDLYEGINLNGRTANSIFCTNTDYKHEIAAKAPNLEELIAKNGGRREPVGENVLDVCACADVTFLALHGGMGENGQVQALLDMHNITYTGSGYAASLLAMDKNVAKKLMVYDKIPTPRWIVVDIDGKAEEKIQNNIGFPCVIKPNSCGSSVGVSMVDNPQQLSDALAAAAKYESSIIAEEKITGREFSIGILGNQVLPAIEIIPNEGFYNYENKYQGGKTTELCPAYISANQVKRLNYLAKKVFAALMLESYARIDFLLDEKKGKFYCLEANTLPGMTPLSLLPQEAATVGISYAELCVMIAESAKTKRKN